jgi:hypothetical protein
MFFCWNWHKFYYSVHPFGSVYFLVFHIKKAFLNMQIILVFFEVFLLFGLKFQNARRYFWSGNVALRHQLWNTWIYMVNPVIRFRFMDEFGEKGSSCGKPLITFLCRGNLNWFTGYESYKYKITKVSHIHMNYKTFVVFL